MDFPFRVSNQARIVQLNRSDELEKPVFGGITPWVKAKKKKALKLGFDNRVRLEFRNAEISSDGGLLAIRDFDESFLLTLLTASEGPTAPDQRDSRDQACRKIDGTTGWWAYDDSVRRRDNAENAQGDLKRRILMNTIPSFFEEVGTRMLTLPVERSGRGLGTNLGTT